jgi:hypothetical protein
MFSANRLGMAHVYGECRNDSRPLYFFFISSKLTHSLCVLRDLGGFFVHGQCSARVLYRTLWTSQQLHPAFFKHFATEGTEITEASNYKVTHSLCSL